MKNQHPEPLSLPSHQTSLSTTGLKVQCQEDYKPGSLGSFSGETSAENSTYNLGAANETVLIAAPSLATEAPPHPVHWDKKRLGLKAICGGGKDVGPRRDGSFTTIYALFAGDVTCPRCHEVLEHA